MTHYIFYVGHDVVGETDVTILRTNGSKPAIWHRHHAFFCPICGEVWGRAFAEGRESDLPSDWFIHPYECTSHGGGSFAFALKEPNFITHASTDFLFREVELLLLHKPHASPYPYFVTDPRTFYGEHHDRT